MNAYTFRVMLYMPGLKRRRLCRCTVRFEDERPEVLAEQGYDPEAIDAMYRGRDGDWYDVTNMVTLARLRAYADEHRHD